MASTGRRALLLTALGLGLGGCGFRLAEGVSLPPELESLRLVTTGFDRRQRDDLIGYLRRAGSRVEQGTAADAYELRLRLRTHPDRRVVSGASTGSSVVRLERSLVFSLRDPAGAVRVADTELVQQTEFRIDDDNLLASDQDRQNALDDLEQQLFEQLLRRLTRIQAR